MRGCGKFGSLVRGKQLKPQLEPRSSPTPTRVPAFFGFFVHTEGSSEVYEKRYLFLKVLINKKMEKKKGEGVLSKPAKFVFGVSVLTLIWFISTSGYGHKTRNRI